MWKTGYSVGQTLMGKVVIGSKDAALFWRQTMTVKEGDFSAPNSSLCSGRKQIEAGEKERKRFKCWEAEKSLVQMDEEDGIIRPEGSLLLRQTARSHLPLHDQHESAHTLFQSLSTHTGDLQGTSTSLWVCRKNKVLISSKFFSCVRCFFFFLNTEWNTFQVLTRAKNEYTT